MNSVTYVSNLICSGDGNAEKWLWPTERHKMINYYVVKKIWKISVIAFNEQYKVYCCVVKLLLNSSAYLRANKLKWLYKFLAHNLLMSLSHFFLFRPHPFSADGTSVFNILPLSLCLQSWLSKFTRKALHSFYGNFNKRQ